MIIARRFVAQYQNSASPPQFGICKTGQLRLLAVLIALLVPCLVSQGLLAATLQPTVRDLSSLDGRQRIEAAEYLTRNWKTQMGPVLQEIAGFNNDIDFIAESKDEQRRAYFRALTDAVRAMIDLGSREAINTFRKEDNHKVIYTLVRAARGTDRGIRINSTIILANVSDNSSVCVAVDELRDPKLDSNGRINLLQVVRTVASYMYEENWQATEKSMRFVEGQLENSEAQDYRRSQDLIIDIESRLDSNKRKDVPLPSRHEACATYKYRFSD